MRGGDFQAVVLQLSRPQREASPIAPDNQKPVAIFACGCGCYHAVAAAILLLLLLLCLHTPSGVPPAARVVAAKSRSPPPLEAHGELGDSLVETSVRNKQQIAA